MDAACTAGHGGSRGCGRRGTCGVGWGHEGVSRHVYDRQVPHKERFHIALGGLGSEGSVWLPNCLKFGERAFTSSG